MIRMSFNLIALLAMQWVGVAVVAAQDAPNTGDDPIARMVAAGLVESLETRFPPPRTEQQLRTLVAAARNRLAATDGAQRAAAGERTLQHMATLAKTIAADSARAPAQRAIEGAAAYAARGRFQLTQLLAEQLFRLEILPPSVDLASLARALDRACDDYAAAAKLLAPVEQDLAAGGARAEERLLLAGVYDALAQVRYTVAFEGGWAAAYRALCSDERAFATLAESRFRAVLALPELPDRSRAVLGLAIALRTQGRANEAIMLLRDALPGVAGDLNSRLRRELGICLARADKFDEARAQFERVRQAHPDEREARVASLHAALCDLDEARRFLRLADRGAATGYTRRALQLRGRGFAQLTALAEYASVWSRIVDAAARAYLADVTDPATMPVPELLFRAHAAARRGDLAAARRRIALVQTRTGLSSAEHANIQFLAGSIAERGGQRREAAQRFAAFVSEHPADPRAAEAAARAVSLWSAQADETAAPADFRALADALRLLLARFPAHTLRTQAQWWLPRALEKSGDLEAARRAYTIVPADHPRRLDALLHAALCDVALFQQTPPPANDRTARARELVDHLERVFDAAHARVRDLDQAVARGELRDTDAAPARANAATVRSAARITQAELFARDDVGAYEAALEKLTDVDNTAHATRAVIASLTAYRALNRPEQLAHALEQFLAADNSTTDRAALLRVAIAVLEQVESASDHGRDQEARRLARAAQPLFARLTAITPDAAAPNALHRARARIFIAAGELDEAERVIAQLPDANVESLRLKALLADAQRGSAGGQRAERNADAWSKVLQIKGLQQKRPARFHEARLGYLQARLAAGHAPEVVRAIEQPRIWGTPAPPEPWKTRFDELLAAARRATE